MRRRTLPGPGWPRLAAALLWLMAALLFGQSLGAMHRIVHAPRSIGAAPWTAVAADSARQATDGSAPASADRSPLARLFAVHGEPGCILLDQALQPSPVAVPASLRLPDSAISKPPLPPVGVTPAGGSSGFEARGPPSLFGRLSA